MDIMDTAIIAAFSFITLCIAVWILPEPNLSGIVGLIILVGWSITFSLWGVIALQKEQLDEQQGTKLTADNIEEYAAEYQTLARQTFDLNEEMLVLQKEMLSQNKEMLVLQKQMFDIQKATHDQNKEMLAQNKEMVTYLEKRLVPSTERSAIIQDKIATILQAQVLQVDVLLKKMGVVDGERPWVPGTPRR